MKQIKKIKILMSVVAVLVLIGVINTATLPTEISAATAVTKENPKLIKKATICVGRRVRLKVTGTTKKVTWSTSNKKIVKISRKGTIRGIKKGTATVTAKVGTKKLTCKVKVTAAVPKITTGLTVENVGWKGISHYSNEIYCKSSNKKVATVAVIPGGDGEETPYEQGADIVVFGHKTGTATITITNDCNTEKVKFKVKVKKPETDTKYQKLVDYILLNGMVEEGIGDKIVSRKNDENRSVSTISYDTMSEQINYGYEEENSFGKVKWLMMPTEKENTEVYMILWLYPVGSKEDYYVTTTIDVTSYNGENIVFEEGWYRIPALEELQGVANEVSQRAILSIDEILQTEAGVCWRDLNKEIKSAD